jgi:molybdopterin converting factor subunit 1
METVRILFFSVAREAAGCAEAEIPIGPAGLSAPELWAALDARFPAFVSLRAAWRLAVNCEYFAADVAISAGDEVAVIPPVSGG